MENITAKIEKKTRKVYLSKSIIGNDGENLQEKLVFSFIDEFVNGIARLELNRNNTKSYIMLTKVDNTYELPIRSLITKVGKLDLQLVITEGTNENEIPIFKSNVFFVIVNPSINAEIEQPEEYPQWIDVANAKINLIDEKLDDIDEAITETNNLDLDVSKSGKVATVTLTKKDTTTKTVTLSDGTSLMFNWDGTRLGIKTDEEAEYTYVDLQGVQGPIGPKGEAFTIKKTYTSVAEMNADFNNMQLGDYVMIASTVEVEDNAKLYTRGENQWIFISDFSGAMGIRGETGLTPNIQIGSVVSGDTPNVTRTGTNENPILNFTLVKGEKGDTGSTGPTGATGNGIANIQKTGTSGLVDTYTITYTDGTTSTFDVTNGEDGEVTQTQFNKLQHRVEDLETNQLMDTATGTNINVEDAHETEIVNGVLSKESTQETTTGKNKFDKVSIDWYRNNDSKFEQTTNNSTTRIRTNSFSIVGGKTYTISGIPNNITFNAIRTYSEYNGLSTDDATKVGNTFTLGVNTKYIHLLFGGENFTSETNTLMKNADIQIEEGSSATNYEKYTGGTASPNPIYPKEVKTVKGYRNLFDKSAILDGYALNRNDNTLSASSIYRTSDYCEVEPNTTYYLGMYFQSSNYGILYYDENKTWLSSIAPVSKFTTPANTKYVRFSWVKGNWDLDAIQLTESEEELPYVPYGTNWVYTTITDGTDTNYYTIPLNDNEIAGKGTFKDELIVDSDGHCWLHKKIGKVTFDGTENWLLRNTTNNTVDSSIALYSLDTNIDYIKSTNAKNGLCDYFIVGDTANALVSMYSRGVCLCLYYNSSQLSNSYIYVNTNLQNTLADFKAWLSNSTPTLWYPMATEQLIDLNYNVDIRLFNGVNNISNSENMDMIIKYVQDINLYMSSIKNAILEIGGGN